jgi:hypothetical protein
MTREIEVPYGDKLEVWIGAVDIVPRAEHKLEDFPAGAAGAIVNILAWTDNGSDYIDQVETVCEELDCDVEEVTDVMPFAQWIAEGFDDEGDLERTQHYMELAQEVRESHEVVLDNTFYCYEQGKTDWEALEDAITDVGYWNWWDDDFPDSVRIEFGGVQLWSPPPEEGQPRRGVVSLHFDELISVNFLPHRDAPQDLPPDWPEKLRADEMDTFFLHDSGEFHFNDEEFIVRVRDAARRIDTAFGVSPHSEEFFDAPVKLGFWAGPIGCIVGAGQMTILNQSGEVPLEQVPELHQKWWEYWEEYWEFRGTENALPEDDTCENTIPAGETDEDSEDDEE